MPAGQGSFAQVLIAHMNEIKELKMVNALIKCEEIKAANRVEAINALAERMAKMVKSD